MPRLIIHTGPAKTGSKYLQSCLYGLRQELMGDGIYYPSEWWTGKGMISHAPLMAQLSARDTTLAETFQRVASAGHHTVVVSGEGFNALPKETLTFWKDMLDGWQVELVFYCRRWSERIPSSWQQTIKEGHFANFPEIYAQSLRSLMRNRGINYALTWEKLIEVFGKDSLRLISYSNLRDQNIDIVRHFLGTILNWREDVQLPSGIVSNISPGPVDTEILRALNYLHFVKTGKVESHVRVAFFRQYADLNTAQLADIMQADATKLYIDEKAPIFEPAYEAISAYKDHLVSPEFGSEIFRRRAQEVEYIAGNCFLRDGVADALRMMYASLRLGRVRPVAGASAPGGVNESARRRRRTAEAVDSIVIDA